ncbi:MAG TPA: hypothetical protein VK918_07635 [Pyrinomonadaceae bacterium]|nr:hypothetical protein [Pyrinomonadaceae bacterium]
MRNITILFAAFLILVSGTMNVTAQKNDEIAVSVGQTGCSEATSIEIQFIRVVEDSRCPEGVDCIWAGRAVVEVRAAKDGLSSETVSLSSDGDTASFEFSGYRIHFEKLEPYPKEGEKIGEGDYKAWFRLEKL